MPADARKQAVSSEYAARAAHCRARPEQSRTGRDRSSDRVTAPAIPATQARGVSRCVQSAVDVNLPPSGGTGPRLRSARGSDPPPTRPAGVPMSEPTGTAAAPPRRLDRVLAAGTAELGRVPLPELRLRRAEAKAEEEDLSYLR